MLTTEAAARDYVSARCDPRALERLHDFARDLGAANEAQNLVAAPTLEEIWRRHIADSAQLLDLVPDTLDEPWVDLGTGAGFPGLVIAIVRPRFRVELIESRKLRIDWLNHVIDSLGLDNCSVFGGNIRAAPPTAAGVISARALGSLPSILEMSAGFSTSRTRWVLPKGRSAEQEVSALPERLRNMFHVEQSLTHSESGIVVGRGMVVM